ncbi:MAG: DUF4976 domain-containing protein, partial [Planctomycetes bacterium]|nr:DUF4976 domain-containing protein [Planctomycetota bacterium]
FNSTLSDPHQPIRQKLLFAYRDIQRGICDERWKFIRYPKIDRVQLFDLHSDPMETNNLADKPEQAMRVNEMMAALKEEMYRSGDCANLIVPNPTTANWTPPKPTSK